MKLSYVDGMLSSKEALITKSEISLLYKLAKETNVEGCVVEIGSYKGASTICLALGSWEGRKEGIYAIDPHTGVKPDYHNNTTESYLANLKNAGVGQLVTTIFKRSVDAIKEWNRPIRLLFIDGSHEYDDVRDDFVNWVPHVVRGGVIALHDATKQALTVKGPRRVVDEYMRGGGFTEVIEVGYTAYATKRR